MRIYTTAVARQGYEAVETLGEIAVESTKMAVKGVQYTARKVKKWRNYRPARYQLIECPESEAVLAQWKARQQTRDPLASLRFGAMLLNVSQYVDSSPIYGRGKHIVARNPGLKGWLRSCCPEINYVTAMAYRKLAEVTCKAIQLPEFIPMEWVLPGTEGEDESRELNPEDKLSAKLKKGEVLRQIQTSRSELIKLLEGASTVNQLNAKLDACTQCRRHRLHVKITAESLGNTAPQILERHLKKALELAESIPEDTSPQKKEVLLCLLGDLQKQLSIRTA